MKTFKLTFALLLLVAVFSCKKTDSGISTTVTSDQAADMVAGSLSSNSEGLAIVTDDIAVNAQTVSSVSGPQAVDALGTASAHQECGTTVTDSVTRAGISNSVTYNYFFKYSHTLNCNANNHPDNLVNAVTFHGNYDGPRISSEGSGSANVTIAGLTVAAPSYVINGEYKRKGSFVSKVGNKASGNSDIDIVVTNLTLTKPDRKISGGTATISISGTWPKKGTFNYNGTVKFNGDGTATVTINGNVYTIDLHTGVSTKK